MERGGALSLTAARLDADGVGLRLARSFAYLPGPVRGRCCSTEARRAEDEGRLPEPRAGSRPPGQVGMEQ